MYFSNVIKFDVNPLTVWSDHSSLSFSLSCNLNPPERLNNSFTRTAWNNTHKTTFRNAIISKLPEFNQLFDVNSDQNRQTVNTVLDGFTSIVHDIADPLFTKTTNINPKNCFSDTDVMKNAEWFDIDCENSKRHYTESANLFYKHKTEINRKRLCTAKKNNTKVCYAVKSANLS